MKNARARIARILSILMILSLLAGGAAFTGAAPDSGYSYAATQAESDFEYTVSGDTAVLTAYTGKDAEPVIPTSIGGYNVTAIGPECFRGNVKIEKITVPEGITEIGDYAFEACSAATELSLPETLETIGKGAFSGDAMLTAIDIPDGVKTIDDGAFLYCMGAKSLTGGEGLEELGQFVFAGTEELKTADISGAQLKVIPDRTFCNCRVLESVSLPDSVEAVGKRAFSNCIELESLSFGAGFKSVGDYAFEDCVSLKELTFDEDSADIALGSKILIVKYNSGGVHIMLPDATQIEDDTFESANIAGLHVYGNGMLIQGEDTELRLIDGQLYGDDGYTLVKAFSDSYNSETEKWEPATETFVDGTRTRVRYIVPALVTAIGPEAFAKKTYANVVIPAGIERIDDRAFRESLIKSVSLSEGDGTGRYFIEEGILYEDAESSGGEGETSYRLVRFFPRKMEEDGNTMSDTTVDYKEDPESILDPEKQFHLPSNVSEIAPYAFYGSEVWVIIPDDTMLTGFGERSFANSGIRDPREEEYSSFGGKIEMSDDVFERLKPNIADTAFEDAWDYLVDFTDEEYDDMEDPDGPVDPTDPSDPADPADPDAEGIDNIGRRETDGSADPGDVDFNDRFSRFDENGEMSGYDDDDYVSEDPVVNYKSLAGSRSLYSDAKYGSYKVISNTGFVDWCEAYLEHNKDEIEFSQELMPYTMLYKGESHYRSMVSVLNHDQYKTQYSIINVGDDYEAMYLMMDHGLEAELMRGEVQEDVVLYSGITVEKMADIAGFEDKSITPTAEQMAEAIGGEFTDLAFMSTTTDPNIAGSFSDHSQTMVVIYASQDSLRRQGAVCLDSFTGWGGGECEILLNPNAKFKILDVGTVTIGDSLGNIAYTRTYVRLELAPYRDFPDSISKAKVTGIKAKYTYTGKAKKPVPVVELNGRKLVQGTDYTLKYSSNKNVGPGKVVITGKGKYTGTITRNFKIIPKGTSIKKLKKAKKAIKVTWKKQSRKMAASRITGYQIQVATNKKFTKGKKTVTVKGYKKVSKKISKLKGKKKYYVRIRTYKTVKGTKYYSAWSKIKKITTRK